MSVSRAENTRVSVMADPHHRIRFPVLLAHRGRERLRVRPKLFDHVKLVHRRLPAVGDAFHYRMHRLDFLHLVAAHMIVPPAGHAEKLAPQVRPGRAIGVHGAMNHHRRDARLVRLHNLADVIRVRGVSETLVMHHHVIAFGPVWIVVEGNLRLGAAAAFIHDGPFHLRQPAHGVRERDDLERIVVKTATRDEQCTQGLRALRRPRC